MYANVIFPRRNVHVGSSMRDTPRAILGRMHAVERRREFDTGDAKAIRFAENCGIGEVNRK